MSRSADMDAGRPRRSGVAGISPYVLTVGAVVLGWQIVIQPLIQRAPVEAAIRIAPGSPLVLGRAAEAELVAGRNANAAVLGREALARAPFNVRALRVVGLTEARAGRAAAADQMLTLAGNWSLRDEPAHAWLVEHRLRRGDYASALAHADTLARRRENLRPQVFRLFTTAAAEDPERALPVIARLLTANPPWRDAYLVSLYAVPDEKTVDGLPVAANLALMLQRGSAPMTDVELRHFYQVALYRGQIDLVKTIRTRLNRPPPGAVTNGDFDGPAAPEPFEWELIQKAGANSVISADDSGRGNMALRVEYDGYSAAVFARQRTFLTQGRYRFSAQARTEAGDPVDRFEWSITCAREGGSSVISASAITGRQSQSQGWVTAAAEFSIPAGCPSQWLELRGRPLDSRKSMAAWFDRVAIVPLQPARR